MKGESGYAKAGTKVVCWAYSERAEEELVVVVVVVVPLILYVVLVAEPK